MNEIDELQARLAAALDRVAHGVETLGSGGAALDELKRELDDEKTLTAQLEERLKTLKERQAAELASLAEQMQDTRAKVDAMDLEMQRLRQAITQLREANMALREANEEGVADPHLINKSMLLELESLRAARAAETAEASAILSALTPILAGEPAGEGADA